MFVLRQTTRWRTLGYLGVCLAALALLQLARLLGASARTDPLSDPAPDPLLATDMRRYFCAPPRSRDHLDYATMAWRRAARLLNASAPGKLTAAQDAALAAFYSFHAGIALLRPGGGTARCAYHRIYKAGNMLQMNEITAWNNGSNKMMSHTAFGRAQLEGVHSFTWTRAPLDRFLSGYGEILYRAMPGTIAYNDKLELREEARSAARRDAGVTFLHLPAGSRDRFAAFLRDLLAGAPIFEIHHVYSATPVFFAAANAGVELVFGQLEAASHSADVKRMHKRCGVGPVRVQGHQYGQSLRDTPIGDELALARSAIEKDSNLFDALCLLLLPDYSCAGYLPPRGCRAVLWQFTEDVERMRRKKIGERVKFARYWGVT